MPVQVTARQYHALSATLNEDVYQTYFRLLKGRFASVGLLGGLYGLLTILSAWSLYSLTQRSGRIQPTAIVLCLTILTLFTSTTIYMVASILSWQTDFATAFIWSGRILWSYNGNVDFQIPLQSMVGGVSEQFQACAGTAALTINVLLSDAIVCWRACVIWQNNRLVCALCSIFLLATFVLGTVDTILSCNTGLHWSPPIGYIPIAGAMYKGFWVGIAACILSLSINFIATLLVGWKAWESRKRVRQYFVGGSVTSRVEKLFALLIESGAIYCAFWVVVVAFQKPPPHPSQTEDTFLRAVGIFLDSCLVPFIAIYPTIIIVFVALHRSHVEKVLTPYNQSVPTPHLSFAIGAIGDSRHDSDDGTSPR